MLSKKLTFSLTNFFVLIAFGLIGLVCLAPSAFADGDAKKTHFDLDVTISAAESMIDVSAMEGLQIASGRHRNSRALELDNDGLTLSIKFSHPVNLETPGGSLQDVEAGAPGTDPTPGTSAVGESGGNFGADDIFVAAFDVEGRQLGVLPITGPGAGITADFIDASSPGRNFLLTIHENYFGNVYGGDFEISKLVFFIPKGVAADPGDTADAKVTRGIRKADFAHVTAHFGPEAHQHVNKASNRLEIDLVDADQGNPMYYKGVDNTMAITQAAVGGTGDTAYNADGSGTPGVVTIDQLSQRSGFIETGPFDVRIILTEDPKGGLTKDMILVEGGGAATAVTKGVSLKGALPAVPEVTEVAAVENVSPARPAIPARPARSNELTTTMASYYTSADFTATPVVITMADAAGLPEATGTDNMYHQYFVTITPNPGVNGMLTISLKQFDDNVIPVPNRYVPLTLQQRDATTLASNQAGVRDVRVMNETLSVQVNSAADTKVAAATAAYDARQKVLDAVGNEIVLGNKIHIPAGGYLVLVADAGKAGIAGSSAKLKEKLTAAQKLYNTTGLGLPFPANDLSNFFRNGGTLNLGYADIPEATDSKHGDSTAPQADKTHADYTGYDGATTNAYTAGALIINEVMWGLDKASTDSQYIELHNPGTAAVGIDNKEWVITVGALPTGYTLIDSVGNNPAPTPPATSGYWTVPGSDGASTIEPSDGFFTLVDIVSMSRVAGSADGTAAASWAESMRPSANLSGRRIGTPGAANVYVMAPVVTPPAPTPEPMAPVATGKDIMISEIMVASDGGRLPQWIELANVSAAAVSLSGWSIDIDNDPADTAVAGEAISIDIGDVTVGKDQVALIISKASTRNSGVGMGTGMIRADRIVDVQSQVSPTDARYSLISEMAFKLTLLPPQTGGIVERGDAVGNLGMGWELPMSEGSRSSLIRREMKGTGATATAIMGTDAAGWMLASDTMLDGAYRTTYYGDDEDMGTPGYDAGGALPVELSKFSAARDRVTGQVTIAWETQSELNNAGFFIKRSQQRNGNFVVVNPTMIPGAGTTAEKQSYTYTDTTAQPNVVYYYQIEDVSLDGNRQTLTRGHRLKGHIGAAGKATTTWGDLKTSHTQ